MLVTIAGTMTMVSACTGGIDTASRPIDTVGRPSPITPLTKPAIKNATAMKIRSESVMAAHWPIGAMRTIRASGCYPSAERKLAPAGADAAIDGEYHARGVAGAI